jgi:hypothetical protein
MQTEQLTPSHGRFLVGPLRAACQHIQLLAARNQLHAYPGAARHALPVPLEQFLFKFAQPMPRRTHQIGSPAVAQLGQVILTDNTPVKDPDPADVTMLGFHFTDDVVERFGVVGVSWEDLMGQRKAFGRDHQRQDHLRTG